MQSHDASGRPCKGPADGHRQFDRRQIPGLLEFAVDLFPPDSSRGPRAIRSAVLRVFVLRAMAGQVLFGRQIIQPVCNPSGTGAGGYATFLR